MAAFGIILYNLVWTKAHTRNKSADIPQYVSAYASMPSQSGRGFLAIQKIVVPVYHHALEKCSRAQEGRTFLVPAFGHTLIAKVQKCGMKVTRTNANDCFAPMAQD